MLSSKALYKYKKNYKIKNLSFNSEVDPLDLKKYEYRAKTVRLRWAEQVVKILDELNFFKKKVIINDLGCNWFQFYKELKLKKKKVDYFGYDYDKKFINIGLKYFPELKKKYKIANIESTKIRASDLNIASIVLDHLEKPKKFLSKFFKSRKLVVLRCYLGGKDLVYLFSNKKLVEKPYFINQFSFENIIRIFHKNKFTPTFYLDKATKLSKEHEISKNYNVYRKIFIIIGSKY